MYWVGSVIVIVIIMMMIIIIVGALPTPLYCVLRTKWLFIA